MIFTEWTAERRGEILSAAARGTEPEKKKQKKPIKMCTQQPQNKGVMTRCKSHADTGFSFFFFFNTSF